MVSGQSFGSSTVSLACITSLYSVQRFPGGHSLCLAFGSFFYPHPSTLYSSTDKSVWQVPGSIGVRAHGWRVQVCQPWGHNSESPGHPGHPPPLKTTNILSQINILTCGQLLIQGEWFAQLSEQQYPQRRNTNSSRVLRKK